MYESIKRLKDFNFKSKRVIMRLDFNVPFDKETREITSTKRIDEALKSIKYILSKDPARLILMSHLGKPKDYADKNKEFKKALSLDRVAEKLSELLEESIPLAKNYLESDLPSDRIILLENTRFYYQLEQSKSDADRERFAKRLASFADIFINDAFGTSHRKEASVYDIAKFLPSGIGFLIDKEIKQLGMLLNNPKRPYIAILGGAKVEDKIDVIEVLGKLVDRIFIVGAMEFSFEKSKGLDVGNSLCEGVEIATKILASEYASKISLPVDTVVAKRDGDKFSDIKTVAAGKVPEGYAGLDIGSKSVSLITKECQGAKTIFWNGPAGLFEVKDFCKGTNAIAASLSKMNSVRIIGGGDSVEAIEDLGLESDFTHVSTGGGASLEYIQFGRLPALDILEKQK